VVSLLTLQAGAQMYIVGDGPFGGWNPAGGVRMDINGIADGTYKLTTTVSGEVFFVFADGLASSDDDWATFNSQYRYGPATGDQTVPVDGTWTSTSKAGDHGAYTFVGDGSQYEFTFDTINKRFKITTGGGTPVVPFTGEVYMLGEVEGHSWTPNVGVPMSSTDGNTFTATQVFAADASWKEPDLKVVAFVANYDSSSNLNCMVENVVTVPVTQPGTDGIRVIDHSPSATDHYYDLSGRRVVHPAKGIYLKNGKKYIKKN
jgi:hypothetical protein